MDFGDFLRGIEKNTPAQEQTKQDILDTVKEKGVQTDASDILGFSMSDLAFPDQRAGKICVVDYKDNGKGFDERVLGEVVLMEPQHDLYETIQTTEYVIFRTPDGLGLAKYENTRQKRPVRTERDDQFLEYLDGLDDEEKKHLFRSIVADSLRREQQMQHDQILADEIGASLVFEPEAVAILKLIREAEPDDNLSI